MKTGPLHGIRVIDFTHALAGPYCTMLLADLGADVIKVEPPGGEVTRSVGPYPEDRSEHTLGGYFQSVNRGKRSIVVDLKSADGLNTIRQLIAESDIVVENFSVGVADKLGLSYESLHEAHPQLIYGTLRGFGDPRSGVSPYADWPAMDVTMQAMAGALSITGTEGGTPVKIGPGVADIFPGTLLALGLVAAVMHARATGEGQHVDIAMYDAVLSLCERIVYQYSYTGEVPKPEGNTHPILSPFDVLEAADGWVSIAAPTDPRWVRLCEAIGRPELSTDPRFKSNVDRRAHRADVRELLQEWTKTRTRADIADVLGGKVPFGPVNTVADIFADPHARSREMLVPVDNPGSATQAVIAGQPIKFSATPARVQGRAPLLDEHGDELRREFGGRARSAAAPPLPQSPARSE
ncbi:CaiB/BaiF CoA transferase family protein [Rhodococcus koreensis]|uniref:CaiB/BaiF CoA transferase family protein n=1 Tax=Rhodococcus koreensis TaxID=99653 RepID=UPI00366E75A4